MNNILKTNKKAWDNIGEKATPKKIKDKKYLEIFNLFCQKLPPNARVLDLGCGPGLPFTKKLVKNGFRVTGVDISEEMIRLAQKNVPQANYIQSSITEINFKNKFDGIFAGYSLLCLDPKKFKKAAQKITRSLKSGGYFLLSLNEPPPQEHRESDNYTTIMGQKIYSRPYTEKEIGDIFSKLDMKIKKVEREVMNSKEYGKEYALFVLMQKE